MHSLSAKSFRSAECEHILACVPDTLSVSLNVGNVNTFLRLVSPIENMKAARLVVDVHL
jgi:hypothetical protein